MSEVFTLSTGMKVRFKQVNGMTVQRAQDSIALPAVYEQEGRDGRTGQTRIVQNPNHADYVMRVAEAEKERSMKALETMVLFGVDLVDPLPTNDEWLDELSYVLDLEKYYRPNGEGVRVLSPKIKTMLYVIHKGAKNADDYKVIAENVMVAEKPIQEQVNGFRDN